MAESSEKPADGSDAEEGDSGPPRKVKRAVNKTVLAAAIVLTAVAAVGVFAVFRFIDGERLREMQAWQVRLGIVADSRAADVEEWFGLQFGVLRELAENASLQLYMTELSLSGGDRSQIGDEPAQASYLRNLLIATAERAGFSAPTSAGEVTANVEKTGVVGLAIADPQGNILVASPSMPPITGRVLGAIESMRPGEPALIDMYLGVSGEPTIGFVTPVFAIQGGTGASDIIGLIIGVRLVDKDLWGRLEQPGETDQTAETYLVRSAPPNIEYLSPLRDGTPPLKRRLAADTAELASAFVIRTAGGFDIRRDYDGQEVLVTGRPLKSAPWTLVRKVARSEALASTESRLQVMLVVFLLVIGGTAITLIAVWRHGTSIRAAEAAERFRVAAERFGNLTKFLRVVTDGQPNIVVAVTEQGVFTFANRAAAEGTGIAQEDMLGKHMAQVWGPVRAKYYREFNQDIIDRREEILAGPKRITHIKTFEESDGKHIIRSSHIPLRPDRDYPPGCLMILDDITELVSAREKREQVMDQLVDSLLQVVGRHDPYSQAHAARASEVARAIAVEMQLEDDDARAAQLAAKLMNLGKTLVPVELLHKTTDISPQELEHIRACCLASADFLVGVDFEGPVLDAIAQMQERWDGKGQPGGLGGEEISVAARVIAVANAFVGMTSPRPYRGPIPFDKACNMLMRQAGTSFDRRPVSALIHYVENRGGREAWADFAELPSMAAE
jgi:PAS domain S-box-containing protein